MAFHGNKSLHEVSSLIIDDHGDLDGLEDDDHEQYVHLSSARTVTAVHTFNPGSATPFIILGANALAQLITGLNADLLDGLHAADIVTAGVPEFLHMGA